MNDYVTHMSDFFSNYMTNQSSNGHQNNFLMIFSPYHRGHQIRKYYHIISSGSDIIIFANEDIKMVISKELY